MSSVTIRNLDNVIKQAAKLAAVKNGRSLEAELRALLERSYGRANPTGESRMERLIRLGRGLELEVPPREHEDVENPFA